MKNGKNETMKKRKKTEGNPSLLSAVFSENCFYSCEFFHYFDVFQWDRGCFIIWVVKLQTRFFFFPLCHRLRFQSTSSCGFPLLAMTVLDD